MEYGNGIVGDMCVHMLDMMRWMLDLGWPKKISSSGGILVDKASKANISDTQTATFDFGDLQVVWQHRTWGDAPDPKNQWGATLYGDKGTLKASVYSYDFTPSGGGRPVHKDVTYEFDKYPEDKTEKDLETHVAPAIRGHMNDLLAAIQTRGQPVADIEEGYISAASCILANLSMKLGRSLAWDADKQQVVGRRRGEQAPPTRLPRAVGASVVVSAPSCHAPAHGRMIGGDPFSRPYRSKSTPGLNPEEPMPAPTVVSDFLECVRKSGVVEPQRLEEYLARPGRPPATPIRMADALVRDGLLTRFQADQLVRGRWRNFILCGKYTILEPLGAGGMGTVYLCSHKIMRRPVAIKVLPAGQADDPGLGRALPPRGPGRRPARHPNIVGAHDVDRDGKFHFLVMEYVDGVSLQELVKRSGPLDPTRAAHYIHQAALGLEHAHEAGLVHRDIKPANLLVDRAGVVKILDLGLARFFRDTKESRHPEVRRQRRPGHGRLPGARTGRGQPQRRYPL